MFVFDGMKETNIESETGSSAAIDNRIDVDSDEKV